MIIFEGADGSGKTTAAHQLSRELQVPIIHSPGYNVNWWQSALNFHVAKHDAIVIYDRFYFSEFIYGPILRGESRVEPWFQEYVEKVWMPAVQPLIVFCHIPYEKAIETVEVESQLEGVKGNLRVIQNAYQDYFAGPLFESIKGPWVIHHDFTRRELDFRAIKSWVARRRGEPNIVDMAIRPNIPPGDSSGFGAKGLPIRPPEAKPFA